MKDILNTEFVKVPEGVTVEVKTRNVRVKGPRGTLTRAFKHLRLEMRMVNPTKLRVDAWFKNRKELSALRTVCSHVENMITGVTKVLHREREREREREGERKRERNDGTILRS